MMKGRPLYFALMAPSSKKGKFKASKLKSDCRPADLKKDYNPYDSSQENNIKGSACMGVAQGDGKGGLKLSVQGKPPGAAKEFLEYFIQRQLKLKSVKSVEFVEVGDELPEVPKTSSLDNPPDQKLSALRLQNLRKAANGAFKNDTTSQSRSRVDQLLTRAESGLQHADASSLEAVDAHLDDAEELIEEALGPVLSMEQAPPLTKKDDKPVQALLLKAKKNAEYLEEANSEITNKLTTCAKTLQEVLVQTEDVALHNTKLQEAEDLAHEVIETIDDAFQNLFLDWQGELVTSLKQLEIAGAPELETIKKDVSEVLVHARNKEWDAAKKGYDSVTSKIVEAVRAGRTETGGADLDSDLVKHRIDNIRRSAGGAFRGKPAEESMPCQKLLNEAEKRWQTGTRVALKGAHMLLDKAEKLVEQALGSLGTPGPDRSALQTRYDSERELFEKQIKPIIRDKDLLQIGGGEVLCRFDQEARRQQEQGNLQKAIELLNQGTANAEKVIAQAPYVKARRAHYDRIKAAMGIGFKPENSDKSYGDIIKEDWKKVETLAGNQEFQAAANQIVAIANYITNTVNADENLAGRKQEVAEQRTKNVENMKELLNSNKVDIEKLREFVQMEIGSPGAPGFAKRASELGDDPGAPSREEIGNTDPEKKFKEHDWFKLKDMLHTGEISKDEMWDCWRYRQKYVTDLIDTLREKYSNLIAKASGSVDLESDIDITFATPHSGDDVEAAREFNKTVIKKFGKPSGRTFDVNIYPRDYRKIKESFNPDFNLDPIQDHNIDEPTDDMLRLSQVDQDVATLLKQRRFLDEESFNTLLESVLKAAPDDKTRQHVQKQYEEGEALYLLTSIEKVDGIISRLKEKKLIPFGTDVDDPAEAESLKKLKTQCEEYEALRQAGNGSGSSKSQLKRMQQLLPVFLEGLEHLFEAEVMETTDEQYLDRMAELRATQAQIAELERSHTDDEKLNALKAIVKKRQFENIIFANEAYMSQGAIEHIVAGGQAMDSDPEEAKRIIDNLTPQTLMQSCNEQLADFFKDMKHYETELAGVKDPVQKRRQTGEAFVHASKYLLRLLDGAELLLAKYKAQGQDLDFNLIKDVKRRDKSIQSPADLKKKVEETLYALRKSSTVPAEVKGEIGVDEVRKLFDVDDIGGFRSKLSEFGTDINAKVRASREFIEAQTVQRETEESFFQHSPVSARDRQLAVLLGRAASPMDLRERQAFSEALSGLGVEEGTAKSIVEQWEQAARGIQAFESSKTQEEIENSLSKLSKAVGSVADEEIRRALIGLHTRLNTEFQIKLLGIKDKSKFGSLLADLKSAADAGRLADEYTIGRKHYNDLTLDDLISNGGVTQSLAKQIGKAWTDGNAILKRLNAYELSKESTDTKDVWQRRKETTEELERKLKRLGEFFVKAQEAVSN